MKTLKTNYWGKKYLEQCPKITIKEVLEKASQELEKQILDITLEGIELIKSHANYGWFRIWFKCPLCWKKAFTLYNVAWNLKCRICSDLQYKKQRFKGMLEEKVYKN